MHIYRKNILLLPEEFFVVLFTEGWRYFMRDIEDYVSKYSSEPFEEYMVKIRKKMVLEQCNKYEHANILEIGCALNPLFLDFDDYKNMVIVEPGVEFVENAKMLAGMQVDKNIKIIKGFFEEQVPYIKNLGMDFDIIILSSVLHEINNPQAMLSAIYSVCSSKTIIHINVPNAKSLHRIMAKEMGIVSDIYEQSEQMKKMQRSRTYDIDSLVEEINTSGFVDIDSGSYFVKPFTHSQLQRCLDLGIVDESYIVGLEKLINYLPEYGAGIYVNCKKGEV